MHRYKADEAYLVGSGLPPVAAYLDIPSIIQIAKENNVKAIHPGYGFLSERAEFARACRQAGLVFIGPSAEVVEQMGDKIAARALAAQCGIPMVPGTPSAIADTREVAEWAEKIGYPLIIKASFGGGGRGMRVVRQPEELEDSFQRASSEALAAFGDGSVFLEKFIENPRHIEVQILGDNYGNIVHLYERDCSVQRRHQKVVELAPASNLSLELREKLWRSAVLLTSTLGYSNAGTVEFLVDPNENYYFIEVNPRLQVEHTVTEEITGIDLVESQIKIASGHSLEELGLIQNRIEPRGAAIQCRITTEDTDNDFRPDTGTLSTYRTGLGMGIRLDAGAGFTGSIITPHYDSLLVKLTSHGLSFEMARRKLLRALKEFRIRGVKTNLAFLTKVLDHPLFIDRKITTKFIDQTPELFRGGSGKNRAQKLLEFLAEIAVNGPQTPLATHFAPTRAAIHPPKVKEPDYSPTSGAHGGWRQVLLYKGPKAFAQAIRNHKTALLTDTTFRDAHQSLLATRVRTLDLLRVAPATSALLAPLLSLEVWGGATFDVALRFLRECPWERLRLLRQVIPNIPFQMLLRGANAVGYTSYADNVVYRFCKQAHENGVDIFRVFDSLNYLPNLQLGIDAVGNAQGVVEAAICYTGDLSSPTQTKYTLDYYLQLATQLVKSGAHILAIKDMAGLLKPNSAKLLISTLRKEFPTIPIHVHTHDTAGTGVASMLAALEAGADVVDGAIDALSGLTSQPSLGALVAALENTPLDTGISLENISTLSHYWEQVRGQYAPFECTATMKSGSSDVYRHEIPGGQFTNLHFQAHSLGMADKFAQLKEVYRTANLALGDIVKVTPTSKVVGDLAQFMIQNNIFDVETLVQRAEDLSFPSSVVEYFKGLLGHPVGGFPEPLRTRVLRGEKSLEGRPGASLPPVDFDHLKKNLEGTYGPSVTISDEDVMSYVMYPQVFEEYIYFKQTYGDVWPIPTFAYFCGLKKGEVLHVEIEKGKTLLIQLKAVGELNEHGFREVFFELNGKARNITVLDKTIDKAKATLSSARAEKADRQKKGSVGAPMPGKVIKVNVKRGDIVKKGQALVVLSAMKMETIVASPIEGKVARVECRLGDDVQVHDLLVEVEPQQS